MQQLLNMNALRFNEDFEMAKAVGMVCNNQAHSGFIPSRPATAVNTAKTASIQTDWKFRPMEAEDLRQVSNLLSRAFMLFLATDYDEDGRQRVLESVTPEGLLNRLNDGDPFIVAQCKSKIIGVVSWQRPFTVKLLSVAADSQHRGVARSLLARALASARCLDNLVSRVSLRTVPSAVLNCTRLGFHRIATEPNGDVLMAIDL